MVNKPVAIAVEAPAPAPKSSGVNKINLDEASTKMLEAITLEIILPTAFQNPTGGILRGPAKPIESTATELKPWPSNF